MGYLTMLVKAPIGVSNHLRGVKWELAEVVFLNQFRVTLGADPQVPGISIVITL